ncbi:MAG: DUF2177 family protein [Proteobacteria bacterium]|nr:DUF2177 family protein [Pseudomonadota bacterium]MBU1057820.1 DUF2177 family protein [Pseudomonadota bacterium]
MLHGLKVYLCLVPLFFLIDYLWLGRIMSSFYLRELGSMARISHDNFDPVIWAAVIVYLLIPLGIVIFVLPGIADQGYILPSLGKGALYGLILYGVYDMTNHSLLQNWSLKMSIVDMAWGGFINGVGTLAGKYLDILFK